MLKPIARIAPVGNLDRCKSVTVDVTVALPRTSVAVTCLVARDIVNVSCYQHAINQVNHHITSKQVNSDSTYVVLVAGESISE